jgi:1,4-dihydroxy-6-naphthoate synthase
MRQHIALYVNEYSRDLGPVGRRAVEVLFERGAETGIIPTSPRSLFVNSPQALSHRSF